MKIVAAVANHVGNIRKNNEDNYYFNGVFLLPEDVEKSSLCLSECEDGLQIYAVCDGMGGEEMGEVASYIAAKTLRKYQDMLNSIKYHSLRKYIDMYIAEANALICEKRKENNYCIIGTTLALLIVENEKIHAVNVGDSRIYRFRGQELKQLTEDHTAAMRAFKMGTIKKEELATHPHRNKLTQYVGLAPGEAEVNPTVAQCKAKGNDRYLICSDGVTDMLSDEEICKVLRETTSAEDAVEKLVNEALQKGGRDNITAIVVEIKKNKKFLWF